MNPHRRALGHAALLAITALLPPAGGACSFLVDSASAQCESDADCSGFAGATCDVATKTCVQAGTGGGGTGGETSSGGTGGAAGGGGTGGTVTSSCADPESPTVEISGEITDDYSLKCNQVYLLRGNVHVAAGVTLSIEKGTTIKGSYVPPESPADQVAVLVIDPGGKISAAGTEDEPIVFTSENPPGMKKKGDWGGLVILGNAPTNHKDAGGQTTQGKIEGLVTGGTYGGISEGDSSGTLKYLRVEYAGYAIGPNNELNGITFGGVGRGTIVDHVQVRHNDDDCFEFFGGTVDAKYLACQYPTDDGVDWDNGYSGKLQFVVVQQDPDAVEDCNGFEGDNDATGSDATPFSNPTIYNATLCGQSFDQGKAQYGILTRKRTKASIFNVLATGFETGWDVRNTDDGIVLQSSLLFANLANNVAEVEPAGSAADDDAGFDEIAYFNAPANENSVADPGLGGCFDADAPGFGPAAPLTANAATPPDDGFFDPKAAYVGAFADAADDWATKGKWAVWSSE